MNRRNFLKASSGVMMGLSLMTGLPGLLSVQIAKAQASNFTLVERYNYQSRLWQDTDVHKVDWQAAPHPYSMLTLIEKFSYNIGAEPVAASVSEWSGNDLTYADQQTVENLNNYMEAYEFNQYNSPVYMVDNVYFYTVDHTSGANSCTGFYEQTEDGLRYLGNSRYPMIWGPVLAGLAFAAEDWGDTNYSPFEGLFPFLFNYVMGWFDRSSQPYLSKTVAGITRVDYQADPIGNTGLITVKAQDDSGVLLHNGYRVRYE